MRYFLAKTEPSGYSVSVFEKEGKTSWSGVRNPQAVKFLRSMEHGDHVLIYHTEGESAIVGLAEVTGNSRPDPHDDKSWLIDMKFIRRFPTPHVTLKMIKDTGLFSDFRLVYQSRLSTMDVPETFIKWLVARGLDLS